MSVEQTIPVLKRSVALMKLIAENPDGLGVKQLSIELGIPPATCYRIVRTLVASDWIQENEAGNFRIGFGTALLARSWSQVEQRIREITPLMRELVEETGLSAKISMREGGQAVCVARVESARPNSITSPIGSTMHLLSAGSAGILLMAAASELELRHILRKCTPEQQGEIVEETALARREGIARSYGRHHPSIYAVSVPVDLGETAAFTIVGWPEDFASPRQVKAVEVRLKKLRDALKS